MKKVKFKRLVAEQLNRKMHSCGCVQVKGPKFCGKSTVCADNAKSIIELKTQNTIELIKGNPKLALEGEKPHLIDEWQKVATIWDYIRDDLDKDYVFGKYLITGSTTPVNPNAIQHSGAGRIASLNMRPLSLFESNESDGSVSLLSLFSNPDIGPSFKVDTKYDLRDIAFFVCRGGWPVSALAEKDHAIDVTKNYYDGLFGVSDENDDYAYFLKNKDIDLLKMVLKECARNVSTEAKKSKMKKDILESGERENLDDDTFASYVDVLKKLFVVYDMPAWNVNLRSSVQVRQAPVLHFYDTSIALASLGIGPSDLINDLRSFGFFFEDFAVRDLSVYADCIEASLKHYRDSNDIEVDAILERQNGDYGAIEIKIYSPDNIDAGIASLLRFEKSMRTSGNKLPSFKMILTSHGPCYKSEEGIYVVPIVCLKD